MAKIVFSPTSAGGAKRETSQRGSNMVCTGTYVCVCVCICEWAFSRLRRGAAPECHLIWRHVVANHLSYLGAAVVAPVPPEPSSQCPLLRLLIVGVRGALSGNKERAVDGAAFNKQRRARVSGVCFLPPRLIPPSTGRVLTFRDEKINKTDFPSPMHPSPLPLLTVA